MRVLVKENAGMRDQEPPLADPLSSNALGIITYARV